jgi:hypothetical protein
LGLSNSVWTSNEEMDCNNVMTSGGNGELVAEVPIVAVALGDMEALAAGDALTDGAAAVGLVMVVWSNVMAAMRASNRP